MTRIGTAAAQAALADELLEPLATGKNPDGTDFTLPVSLDALASGQARTVTGTLLALNSAVTLDVTGMGSAFLVLAPSASLTAGAVAFEVTTDGTNWRPIQGGRIDAATAASSQGVSATTVFPYEFGLPAGVTGFRARVTTAITGGNFAASAFASARFVEPVATVQGTVQAQLANSTNTVGSVIAAKTTTNGLSMHRNLSAGASTIVKAAVGQLYTVNVTNLGAAVRFLKFYNTATAITLGAGTPALTVPIQPGGTITLSAFDIGAAFSVGIGYVCTTGFADADTTLPGANEVFVNLFYA